MLVWLFPIMMIKKQKERILLTEQNLKIQWRFLNFLVNRQIVPTVIFGDAAFSRSSSS